MSVMSESSDQDFLSSSGDFSDYFDYHEESAGDIWENCVVLSVTSIVPTLSRLILCNFLFALILSTGILSLRFAHFLTGCIGIYLINCLETDLGKFVVLVCFVISFALLHLSYYLKKFFPSYQFLLFVSVSLITLCEYYLIEPEIWMQVRGIIMVLAMKIISLADDIEKSKRKPNIVQYFGYILCGANVLFGPWISFHDYLQFYKKPVRKNILWIFCIFQVVVTSVFYLTLSNCWINYFITEDSNRWLIAYREAFGFRTSHYFISFLSEAGMLSAGFFNNPDRRSPPRYTVTEPILIEFPTSLSVVVRKWNQPMHDFLKKYVYRSWLSCGKFTAIFITFLISSFLHGLELKVSMVLVTIGVFSYLQVAPREKLADIFDICIKVRPCRDCKHKYRRNSKLVRTILFLYSSATIMHLAYLGVLMDSSTNTVGIIEKWQNLYFVSHIIMFFNLLIMC